MLKISPLQRKRLLVEETTVQARWATQTLAVSRIWSKAKIEIKVAWTFPQAESPENSRIKRAYALVTSSRVQLYCRTHHWSRKDPRRSLSKLQEFYLHIGHWTPGTNRFGQTSRSKAQSRTKRSALRLFKQCVAVTNRNLRERLNVINNGFCVSHGLWWRQNVWSLWPNRTSAKFRYPVWNIRLFSHRLLPITLSFNGPWRIRRRNTRPR
jgi:hypothetical protein